MRVLVLGKTLRAETHVIWFLSHCVCACASVRLTVISLHDLVPVVATSKLQCSRACIVAMTGQSFNLDDLS